jgi:asparagine synthase (glutamine-hydrolysing)
MQTEDGRVALVYNGEVYNFWKLRGELERQGVQFRSRSDTEVVLQAYVRWGPKAFSRLKGMFAFAIWDARSQSLHLVRDRFGIKPLYYCFLESGVVFGSEIKALLASDRVSRHIDVHALHEYMYFGNALGAHTMFDGIIRLLPGHHLTLDSNGAITTAYWSVDAVEPVLEHTDRTREAVLQHLSNAVRVHLISDVPVGIFLSGGIDSSAVTALASRAYDGRLKTFSVAFDFDRGAGELPKAKLVAQQFGTDHHELFVAGTDVPAVIEQLVHRHDEPFADAANIPLYLLCEQLQGTIKVVLQGDGGDEMFAGYRRYVAVAFERLWRWVAQPGLLASHALPGRWNRERLTRFLRAIAQSDRALQFALLLTLETLECDPTRVLSRPFRERALQFDPFARYRHLEKQLRSLDPVQRLLFIDASVVLPDTFLEKVDKATMSFGIEARVPFLDADLGAYALGLPSSVKVRGFQKKWILRRALQGTLPDSILNARKRGFGVPVAGWLRGPLVEYLRSVLLDQSTLGSGLFDGAAIEAAIDDHIEGRKNNGFLLYKALNLALWHRFYLR